MDVAVSGIAADSLGARRIGAIAWDIAQRHVPEALLLPDDAIRHAQLTLWKETLEKRGVTVSPYTRHEILESIYFRDPNGYPLEVTLRLRDTHMLDAKDAEMTLEAAMQLEDEGRAGKERLRDIDTVWRRKAKLVEEYITAE